MPELSAKTGVLREAALAGELVGHDLLVAKREFHLQAESPGEWTDAATGRHYEVVGREADGDLTTFFVRAWTAADKKTQFAFGRPGRAVGIERFRFQNIPVLTEDPLGGFEECGIDETTGLMRTRPKLIEDPLLVARELVRQQVALTARIDPGADFKAVGRTVTTFYSAAGASSPVDGVVHRSGVSELFATIIAGAGNASSSTGSSHHLAYLEATSSSNLYAAIRRFISCFDTSAISPDSVNSATLSYYGIAKTNGLGDIGVAIVSSNPASTSAIANSDFSTLGSTTFASIAYGSLSTTGYNDAALNASGISNINTSGISKFGTRSVWDVNGSFTGAWASLADSRFTVYSADRTGTTEDPKLTVTHGEAAAAGGALLMAAAGG